MINFAHKAGRTFSSTLSRGDQKAMGQYMTPPAIAGFMARRLVVDVETEVVRLLEPAAGAGILAAATVQALLDKDVRPTRIELLMYELDERLVQVLEDLCHFMFFKCAEQNVELDWKVCNEDFLLSELATGGHAIQGLLVISNPPYFKISKSDIRAESHGYAVYGQPNIYGLFMAACARVVTAGGKWCFITPRSWMNGNYFSEVRRTIFLYLHLTALHTFENRTEHFAEDEILQEAVITWGVGVVEMDARTQVIVTRSRGIGDIEQGEVQALPLTRLIGDDEHQMVALPTENIDPFAAWQATLDTYGLKVSTGPVVPFRSTEYISLESGNGTVPLLWMQHVSNHSVKWPIQKKREHIRADGKSAWMLVKNVPMVLMRRFSPNESERRITVSAYTGGLPGDVLGLENHLNYIYRMDGDMLPDEAKGISAFLGSRLVEDHFRGLAGSTQINATELRKLKLPPMDVLIAIGLSLPQSPTTAQIDCAVEDALALRPQEHLAA